MIAKKKKREIFRFALLLLLFVAVGFALYKHYSDDNKQTLIGEPAPNFKLKNINDKTVELQQSKGKVTLVNFWGSWCEPCKREMPLLQSMYSKYHNRGFEILSVNSQESNLAVKNYAQKYHLSFPVLLDLENQAGRAYNVYKLPASFLIDSNGKVVEGFEGELNKKQLEGWILEGLK
ncbi:thiol-disulfide oxidoreductase ResA [Fictibacillus fluitans]|uniref:Thiol-disulfide oxidoreductase ResA n=1 Tax=Fictibacillus fluitans TaxID=3058422 RepID=A0ABT8I090_9BACL|nr:thiol-disulfide oxidoreductase ResA [Fictibacillus sp. NE201]MDN4526451.1 thiol-disulfide oxidoreductase ResA [Fictibacillus sp. NE201]